MDYCSLDHLRGLRHPKVLFILAFYSCLSLNKCLKYKIQVAKLWKMQHLPTLFFRRNHCDSSKCILNKSLHVRWSRIWMPSSSLGEEPVLHGYVFWQFTAVFPINHQASRSRSLHQVRGDGTCRSIWRLLRWSHMAGIVVAFPTKQKHLIRRWREIKLNLSIFQWVQITFCMPHLTNPLTSKYQAKDYLEKKRYEKNVNTCLCNRLDYIIL